MLLSARGFINCNETIFFVVSRKSCILSHWLMDMRRTTTANALEGHHMMSGSARNPLPHTAAQFAHTTPQTASISETVRARCSSTSSKCGRLLIEAQSVNQRHARCRRKWPFPRRLPSAGSSAEPPALPFSLAPDLYSSWCLPPSTASENRQR